MAFLSTTGAGLAVDAVRNSAIPIFATDDRIEIILDTYHDRRNAFRFSVNPLGTQQDALITDEGRDIKTEQPFLRNHSLPEPDRPAKFRSVGSWCSL
jgi:hypothetical protein